MDKVKRQERRIGLTKILVDHPNQLFSLSHFSSLFDAAKSTVCEDMEAIRLAMDQFGLGRLETVSGAAGGVKFLPVKTATASAHLLAELAQKLSAPDRIIAGGFLYMSDILFTAQLMMQVGEVFMTRFAHQSPDYIMTVETKGIPLAFATARAFNLPLVTVRRGSRVTEGSSMSINYVTGSSRRIQTMSLPRRAIPAGARVLIIDDFMKAGGTARGMLDLAQEVAVSVVGIGVLVATAEPLPKLVEDYLPLLILHEVDEHNKKIDIRPAIQG
ncbi:MAG: pur operon repressor [Negativicutes bacterium]|nr:pur operon repressor [Negativicutes bacterium]